MRIQNANFDLVKAFGIDVVHTYDDICDGIDVGNTISPIGMVNVTDSWMLMTVMYVCNWINVLVTSWLCECT